MTTSTAWLLAAWRSRPLPTAHRQPPPPNPTSSRPPARPRLQGDRGEGVISVAIAVLIMAFLGAAMWLGFQSMWKSTSEKTSDQVEKIGED